MKIVLVVAIGENGVIGRNGAQMHEWKLCRLTGAALARFAKET